MSPPASTHVIRGFPRALATGACLVWAACASAGGGGDPATASGPGDVSAETSSAEGAAGSHTAADVRFMRGMIHHHAQAVAMARLVPGRAASPAVRRLAARIRSGQGTEIALMADWLRDRGEPVPGLAAAAVEAAEAGAPRGSPGREREAGDDGPADLAPPGGWDAGPQMPGVLSDAQMARLEAARGETFDRLFLTFMIEHHEGAVTMVDRLVQSPGAAREESVFRLASGIRADQSTEIDRMQTMLRDLLFGADRRR